MDDDHDHEDEELTQGDLLVEIANGVQEISEKLDHIEQHFTHYPLQR